MCSANSHAGVRLNENIVSTAALLSVCVADQTSSYSSSVSLVFLANHDEVTKGAVKICASSETTVALSIVEKQQPKQKSHVSLSFSCFCYFSIDA